MYAAVMFTTAMLVHAVSFAGPVDTSNLMLLLHLDEPEGDIRDTSGEDFAVKVAGAKQGAEGQFGGGIEVDGKGDHVVVDGVFCFAEQTIMLWVKPPAGEAAGGIISSQKQPGARSHWRWRLSRNADRTVSFHLYDGSLSPKPDREARSKTSLPDGIWSHVAVTIDTRKTQQTVLYIDGKREAEAHVTHHSPYGSLFLGTSTVEGHFAGAIDEVAIFDRALFPKVIGQCAQAEEPLPNGTFMASDSIVLRPISDTAWFTFKHPKLGRRRWNLRMPEYMYVDPETKKGCTPHSVEWEVLDNRKQLKMQCGLSEERKQELGLDFCGTVTAHADTIDYELEVVNVGDEPWPHMHMALFCLQCGNAEGFLDYEAQRTFVRKGDAWVTMNEVVKGKFADHRMCGVGVSQGYARLAARVSDDGKFVLGIATDIATSLSFNFQNRIVCLHSNPYWGLLKPGAKVTAKGRIYLFEGTLDDLWRRYCADTGRK